MRAATPLRPERPAVSENLTVPRPVLRIRHTWPCPTISQASLATLATKSPEPKDRLGELGRQQGGEQP